MEIKLTDLDRDVKRMLRKLHLFDAEAHEKLVKITKQATDKIEEESVLRSPVDEGNLQGSHESKVEDKKEDIIGHIYIPANSPAADYALYMHESHYNLGEQSLAKQAKVNVVVGRKYLERALNENRNKLKLFFIKQISRMLK